MPEKKDNTPATHDDLDIWGGRLQLKIQEAEKRVEKNMEKLFQKFAEEIIGHIDSAVEIQTSKILGGSKDEIHHIKITTNNHEKQITALEEN